MFLNHYHLFVCIKQNLEDQNISDNLPFSFSKSVYWPIFWKHDFYPINRFSMESKECLDKGILFHLSYFWTAINFAGCRFNQNLILRANEFTTKKFLLSWRKNFCGWYNSCYLFPRFHKPRYFIRFAKVLHFSKIL